MAFALDAAACDQAEQQFNEADVVLSQQIINDGGSAPEVNFGVSDPSVINKLTI